MDLSCNHDMNDGRKLMIDEPGSLQAAVDALAVGRLVGVPTETVYGLAADATNPTAVAAIYQAKGRPSFNPLIAHVADLKMAKRYGQFADNALELAHAFWPGPLTLVVPLVEGCGVADAVTAGLPTIALRHPKGAMAELARRLNRPIAAPSANRSGKTSPTTADHVVDDLGDRIALVLDGGACDVGIESTIVKCQPEGCMVLREGGLSDDAIETVVGPVTGLAQASQIESPGQLLRHYAPTTPLRMSATNVRADEALLAFGNSDANSESAMTTLNLSASGDLSEAAHNLFAMMRDLDRVGAAGIAVAPIPETGLGVAINDRLKRAAEGSNS